jgi:uncharacterized protein with von Willebrand factor type A (vWA) domain
MTEATPDSGHAAAARIAGFIATLRANGFSLGQREAQDALRLAACFGPEAQQELRLGWRSLACARAADWHRFDDLFDSYWRKPNRIALVESHGAGAAKLQAESTPAAAGGKLGPILQSASGTAPAPDAGAASAGASHAEALETADFATLAGAEPARAMEPVIRAFVRRLKRVRSRREAPRRQPGRIDLRRTLRAGVGGGGVTARLHYQAPRRERPRLVLLLDISRSMSLHSFFFLRVARALALDLRDVFVFLFATQLSNVSAALTDADPWRAQERLLLMSTGWAGGTRIGESLASFNRLHAGRLVHGRTAVIIASDGYETGDPAYLAQQMSQLSRRARLIAWLNPGKATPGWTPSASGMRAAQPYIDALEAGNSLAALEKALSAVLRAL